MSLPTEIRLYWPQLLDGAPTSSVSLTIMCPSHALTSEQLHNVADVVEAIESMRDHIASELEAAT